MKILVVNDDGVRAEGIKILVEKLYKYAQKIYVVAPETEKSATSHALTIKKGISYTKLENIYKDVETYSVTGTPADCVAFSTMYLQFDFDVVFSGVNKGYNLGNDIIYSGTVAAASEAIIKGKKGIAISCKYDSFEAMSYFDQVMDYLLKSPLWDEKAIININIPINPKGIVITHQSQSTYKINYVQKEDGLFYSTYIKEDDLINDEFGDLQTIEKGYVSISPLTNNYTNQNIYSKYH